MGKKKIMASVCSLQHSPSSSQALQARSSPLPFSSPPTKIGSFTEPTLSLTQCLSFPLLSVDGFLSPGGGGGGGRRRYSSVPSCSSFTDGQSQSPKNEESGAKRRELLLQMALGALSLQAIGGSNNALAENGTLSSRFVPEIRIKFGFFFPPPRNPRFSDLAVAADEFKLYVDNANKFKISIPLDWQVGGGEPNDSFKSVTAFYPKEDLSSNVSVVITGIGPDFTTMGSFGKVDAFAESLVNGLDRSWQRPPGLAAKLIDCKAANGFYYIEYSLQNPGESRRHIYSAIGMASNGWYNRLYTVTGQFLEEESQRLSSKIEKAVASFRFT
ncbi:psbP domain-containing protein 3, chloroplastic isoform X1 [Punica granatum]|uniref:PsbP domain-containing protein 3, chloroplastic isoform X1 n=1 Tax=Punica granatum TaxID=22663 RepID=A0A6P8EKR0_PUNGR|nr:psbP domain-containing protein 3, chloroplastic isoform X1 [Punica granatum]